MFDYFLQGGPVLMILITITGIATAVLSVKLIKDPAATSTQGQVLGLVLITMIIGIIGQSLGIIQVLQMLEAAGEVPPALISGGLKSTFIPFVYAAFWSLIGALAWFYSKKAQ